MFKKVLLFFSILICVDLCFSKTQDIEKVQVAFLEFYDPQGNLVSLERGGRFGHVAISYKGGWLHSFPPRPVEWVPSLEPFGVVSEILDVYHFPNYEDNFINQEMGKQSTVDSEWEDTDTTYCSKLVGQILGIPPRPNKWDAPIWQKNPREIYTLMGLSPDDIYEHLIANQNRSSVSYITALSCNQALH